MAEHIRELSVERGDDLSDGLGGTSRGRNDVGRGRSATSPVLSRGSIDSLLGGSGSVDGSHETFDETELVVDDLGNRGETVGGAGSV